MGLSCNEWRLCFELGSVKIRFIIGVCLQSKV